MHAVIDGTHLNTSQLVYGLYTVKTIFRHKATLSPGGCASYTLFLLPFYALLYACMYCRLQWRKDDLNDPLATFRLPIVHLACLHYTASRAYWKSWQAEFTAEYYAKTILPLRPICANAQGSSALPRVHSNPCFIADGLLLHCRHWEGEQGRGAGAASKFRKCACARACTGRWQLCGCARRWRSLEHLRIRKDGRPQPQQSAGRDDADVDEDRAGSSASEYKRYIIILKQLHREKNRQAKSSGTSEAICDRAPCMQVVYMSGCVARTIFCRVFLGTWRRSRSILPSCTPHNFRCWFG